MHELLFPKLVTSEFGTPLDEVADGSRPKAGQKSRGSFFRNNKTPSRKEAAVCKCGVYLDTRFDDIDRCGVPGVGMKDSRGKRYLRVMAPCVILQEK
jgi:hypothetical protein